MRSSLRLLAVLVLALAGSACGDDGDAGPGAPSPPASIPGAKSGEELAEPTVIASENGQLVATLKVGKASTEVAGVPVEALTYNGSFMPPMLSMAPGDHVEV